MVVVVLVASTVIVGIHATAPGASAECPPAPINTEYLVDVGRARAAAVGNIATFGREGSGGWVVRSVYVDHGYRIPRSNIHGTFLPGSCNEPFPEAGERVIVLLDVAIPGSSKRVDLYFTVGVSVSPALAARVGADLPDTEAASAAPTPATTSARWPLLAAGGLGFGLALGRVRRGGAPRLRPGPRTRAA